MKKYKRKPKASNGAWSSAGEEAIVGGTLGGSIGSLIGPEGTVIGAAAGALIGGVYGYVTGSQEDNAKKDRPQYEYSLIGNSMSRAGSTTGAYTDLSKRIAGYDKSGSDKVNQLESQKNTVNAIAGGASSVAGMVKSNITPKVPKPTPETPSLMSDNTPSFQTKVPTTIKDETSLTDVGQRMSSQMVSTPDSPEKPSQFDSLIMGDAKTSVTPFIKDNTPKEKPTTFDTLLGNKNNLFDTKPQMETGGKNKQSPVPVEAEGGEMKIQFDDNYNIINKTPIVGASHEKGGVDVKLPKNHAILNKDQIARLNAGEPLKSIVASLPDVNGVNKAVNGTVGPDGEEDGTTLLEGIGSIAGSIWDWGKKTVQTGINTYSDPNYQSGVGGDLKPGSYASGKGLPVVRAPKTTTPPAATSNPTSGKPTDGLKLNNTINLGGSIDFMKGKGDGAIAEPPDPITKMSAPMNANLWDKLTPENYFGEPQKVENPSLITTTDETNKFHFGYAEKKALGDLAANMIAIAQPRPKGVTVPITHVGTPSFVTPRFLNPKVALNEVGKQINTGVKALTQAGKSDMIPSLISAGVEASNKVSENFAQINSQQDTAAMSENSKASNQFTLTQAGINSSTADLNAKLELEKLKTEGLQDSERYKAISNLMYGPADYEKAKSDEQMREAVRKKLMVDMYMKK